MFEVIYKALVGVLVLFTCLPIHECAHAWAAEKLGDPTGRYQGRITLNPLVHLDVIGSICLVVSSVMGFGFGWAKPVQVNPNNFKNRKVGMALTALAGPASNVLLGIIIMIIYKVLLYSFLGSAAMENIGMILSYMIMLNIGLAVFNLLPIPPLDGSRILGLILPERILNKMYQYQQFVFIGLMLIMFSGILSYPLSLLQSLLLNFVNFATGWVDMIMKAII